MSYSDKTFGDIFPVRDVATGQANERQMLDTIDGSVGFRTRQRDNPDGSVTTLRTKNGMPRFYTDVPKMPGCPLETGPIHENLYANRVFYSNDGALFSHDRLYSVERQATKSIDVLLPNGIYSTQSHLCMAKPLVINGVPQYSGGTIAAQVADGDFVETSRSYRAGNIRTFIRTVSVALLFYSKAAWEAITFSRQTCAVRTLTLNFVGQTAAIDPDSYLSGSYNVGTVDTTAGLAKEIKLADTGTTQKLVMKFGGTDAGKGGFLEEIHPLDWEKVGQHQAYAEDGTTKLYWPVPYKFGPPTRGFTCSLGTFEDETRSRVNSLAQDNLIFESTSAGEQGAPSRYFNFHEAVVADIPLPGTTSKLTHDAIFNLSDNTPPVPHFHSAPGMSSTELRADEHLYRDPTGAVWVIRVTCVPGGTDLLRFWLMRRFDRVFRTDTNFNLLIGSYYSTNSGNDPVDDPEGFYLTGAMQVLSLPDGSSCGITLYSPVTTTGLVIARFSGTVDKDTGAGLSVACTPLSTWISSETHTDAAPIVERDTNDTYQSFVAGDASGISYVEIEQPIRMDYGYTLWSQWAIAQPTGTTGGPFVATLTYTQSHRASQKSTQKKKRNIEIRPTVSNSWEPVVSEWELTTDSYVETEVQRNTITNSSALSINLSVSSWTLSGGGSQSTKVGVKRTSTSKVSWLNHSAIATVTSDYGVETSSAIKVRPNAGYSQGPGYGFLSNTGYDIDPAEETPYDNLSGDYKSMVALVPDPNHHTYGTTWIRSPSACYTPEVWLMLGGSNRIVVAFGAKSLFGGYEFATMLPSNRMELVCHDSRNERVWVAGSKAEAGFFY